MKEVLHQCMCRENNMLSSGLACCSYCLFMKDFIDTNAIEKISQFDTNVGILILTDVLWGTTCAFVLLPLIKMMSQAEVDEFDVGLSSHFV